MAEKIRLDLGDTTQDLRGLLESCTSKFERALTESKTEIYAGAQFQLKKDASSGNTYSLSISKDEGKTWEPIIEGKLIMEMGQMARDAMTGSEVAKGDAVTLQDLIEAGEKKRIGV